MNVISLGLLLIGGVNGASFMRRSVDICVRLYNYIYSQRFIYSPTDAAVSCLKKQY